MGSDGGGIGEGGGGGADDSEGGEGSGGDGCDEGSGGACSETAREEARAAAVRRCRQRGGEGGRRAQQSCKCQQCQWPLEPAGRERGPRRAAARGGTLCGVLLT